MKKFNFYIGLCVLEKESICYRVAEKIASLQDKYKDDIHITYKASFDKANRSSIDSFRGPGLDNGLKLLEDIKVNYKLPVMTDFHLPQQADAVARVVDILQVPAFLCRQTDMILKGAEAALKYNRLLNVKKGQFLSPSDTHNIIKKACTVLPKDQIVITERGYSFGYNNLIVDMASFQVIQSFGVKTIYDATHSVQQPGGMGTYTGGKRDQINALAQAAVAAGADGIFMETHPNPDKALSDKTSSLPLEELDSILEKLINIRKAIL